MLIEDWINQREADENGSAKALPLHSQYNSLFKKQCPTSCSQIQEGKVLNSLIVKAETNKKIILRTRTGLTKVKQI
jgi:hypothetical protein